MHFNKFGLAARFCCVFFFQTGDIYIYIYILRGFQQILGKIIWNPPTKILNIYTDSFHEKKGESTDLFFFSGEN